MLGDPTLEARARPDQRGIIGGLLNLSRNLGLITGASVMGAVFAHASATTDVAAATPEAIAAGMRITFSVAAMLIVVALAIAVGGRVLLLKLDDRRHTAHTRDTARQRSGSGETS